MPHQDPDAKPTLQDDRAQLAVDPEDDSPLVSGEGAPLAEDGVQAQPREELTTTAFIGGAPLPIDLNLEHRHASGIAAAEDVPIND
jgi:hypothetical protein